LEFFLLDFLWQKNNLWNLLWRCSKGRSKHGVQTSAIMNRQQFANSIQNNSHQKEQPIPGFPGGVVINQAIS